MLRRRFTTLCAAMCAAVGLVAIAAAPAVAIGYYNLPGSFCQCFGYGNGAGITPAWCSALRHVGAAAPRMRFGSSTRRNRRTAAMAADVAAR